MTTAVTAVDDTVYVLLTAADALVQNTSSYPIRVIFAGSLPSVNDANYHTIDPTQAVLKSAGLPAGNIYARSHLADRTCTVSVSI
tara:strand:- start:24701 stop:24955 length:255 start_codon:yes stop_codon:yes gene_type:complete